MQLEYFRMVDRIASLDLAARSVAVDCVVPEASPVFEGHFPRHPILPGVLMIETIAQTAGWLIMALNRFAQMPLLAQVKDAKMRAFINPGDRLRAEGALLHDGSGYAVARGRLARDGKPVAEAQLTYRILPFPNDGLRDEMLALARSLGVPDACMPEATTP